MRRAEAGSDASVQATAEDAATGKLSAASLGYFDDPFLQLLVRTPTSGNVRRLSPVMNRGNFARVSCMEKLVVDFLSKDLTFQGKEDKDTERDKDARSDALEDMEADKVLPLGRRPQVISLGAGKDTLFFRLKSSGRALSSGWGYFEVDFEAVVSWKARIIERLPALSSLTLAVTGSDAASADSKQGCKLRSDSCGRYSLIAADLRDTSRFKLALSDAGVDFSAPTIFLAECVLVYMEPQESLALLEWCASSFDNSLFAAYEMTSPGDAFGKMMVQNIQRMGCFLPGLDTYPTLSSQQERFATAGWDMCKAADMLEVFQTFLDQDEVRRASSIEILDEIEEWELIMRHYCLVVAAKGGDAVGRLTAMSLAR